MNDRLKQQLEFLFEIDKLKTVFRRSNLIADRERLENSAEHSWHLALYAMVLHEYAKTDIDLLRVIKMVLIHDVVEIDAGDTFCYDTDGYKDKAEREQQAAKRIFGLLPDDQRDEMIALWQEFELGESNDAQFAVAVDVLHPLMNNYKTEGGSWRRHDIKRSQVERRIAPVRERLAELNPMIDEFLEYAINQGFLRDE